jgi:hypothetical protein
MHSPNKHSPSRQGLEGLIFEPHTREGLRNAALEKTTWSKPLQRFEFNSYIHNILEPLLEHSL